MVLAGRQAEITGFFDQDAGMWDAYYRRRDAFSLIHQLRATLALRWIDDLTLAAPARVLEVGCGTGLMAVELARRGHSVTALDPSWAMLTRARRNATETGLWDRITLLQGDASNLPVPTACFDLVVALGVVPWLPEPAASVAEMVRALDRGGWLVVNCDNRHRLAPYLDPKFSPLLVGVRAAAKRALRRQAGASNGPTTVRHSRVEFDGILTLSGATRHRGLTFGFGPFTFMGREAPRRAGIAMHRVMQTASDTGLPPFSAAGAQYLVLASKTQA